MPSPGSISEDTNHRLLGLLVRIGTAYVKIFVFRVFLALGTILTLAEINKLDISLPQLRTQSFDHFEHQSQSLTSQRVEKPSGQQSGERPDCIHNRSPTSYSLKTQSIHKQCRRNHYGPVGHLYLFDQRSTIKNQAKHEGFTVSIENCGILVLPSLLG